MTRQDTISKVAKLDQSEDYYFLRKKGIQYIEQMGSFWWTDYNSHDPGITILEALCYAITDLGYRAGWEMKDLLQSNDEKPSNTEGQAFFTARNILTTNPLTTNDYRRILLDMDEVRNAWVICRDCACEVGLYGDLFESKMVYQHPAKQGKVVKIVPKGTYDVLLELENDPKYGDLNNRKIRFKFDFVLDDGTRQPVVLEAHFPLLDSISLSKFYESANVEVDKPEKPKEIDKVELSGFSLNLSGEKANESELMNWRNLFYTDFKVIFKDNASVKIEHVSFKLFGNAKAISSNKLDDFVKQVKEVLTNDVLPSYVGKMAKVRQVLREVKDNLNKHRNLSEDFCCTEQVSAQDVAVCAEIEVELGADLELVQSRVLFEIENYFNPVIKFYTLREMLESKVPVEQIFEGPPLKHGFIKAEELDATQWRKQLRTSDIINRIVEIEGIIAVKGLMLTSYDDTGLPIKGISDIGSAGGDANQISAHWTLEIGDRCQPRLYAENSKLLFIKNGLPFLARPEEVHHTLQQLRGESERIKIQDNKAEDLEVPKGIHRALDSYFPVQNSFPLTYGIGHEGLPANASPERKAKAKQLKAFLFFFEQLLGNQLAQLANLRNLFSIKPDLEQTYYVKNLRDESLISGVTELVDDKLDNAKLNALVETKPEFLERRNKFLDHILARFAEDFTDYALTKFSLEKDRLVAQKGLIEAKSKFLETYDYDSQNRARAENYKAQVSDKEYALIRRRIARLLGLGDETEKQILIIEHILLRPRFPGDALMPVCMGPECPSCVDAGCGYYQETGPYSFQLTIVMPSWQELSDDELKWRQYAERTIFMQIPAHLVAKICWVRDSGLVFNPKSNKIKPLMGLLKEKGMTANGTDLDDSARINATENIWAAFMHKFQEWKKDASLDYNDRSKYEAELINYFTVNDPFVEIKDPIIANLEELRQEIFLEMTKYFAWVAMEGLQYSKIRQAWEKWRAMAVNYDWCERMPLRKKIEAVLTKYELTKVYKKESRKSLKLEESKAIRQCASQLMGLFGEKFYSKVTLLVGTPQDMDNWDLQDIVHNIFLEIFHDNQVKCAVLGRLNKKPQQELEILFKEMYTEDLLKPIKYLKQLVNLVTNLSSIFPPATLHDCDDGSDENPVRLGATALGDSG